jgi:2-polyprenyl-6-methoxyphenol hydroxylase-like FAD-dependent oxidoreductase
MPTDAGLYMAGVAPPVEQRRAYLADTDASLARGLQRVGEVAEFVGPARRVGRVRVMARWHGYFREAAGPGWVLVGDAGHFKDPTPAQGISDALRQGERLAGAVELGLAAGGLRHQLDEWWRWRDQDAWEMHWLATDMGAAGNNPGIVTEVMRDLASKPDGQERFLRVLNHDLRPSKVFGPAAGLRALARAGTTSPTRLPRLLRETGTLAGEEIRRQRLRRRRLLEPSGPDGEPVGSGQRVGTMLTLPSRIWTG